jgi:hypothetical protein
MTGDDRNQIPGDWDALVDRSPAARSPAAVTTGPDRHGPPVLTLMASAWADLVGMLAVCTGALIAILLLGERPALPAFSWAAALAVVWWIFAASILVVVRQATPGMLLAGVSFGSSGALVRSSVWRQRPTWSTAPRECPRKTQALRRLKTIPI